MLNVIFIDWISTSSHKNFNKSFFNAVDLKHFKYFVFNQDLIINSEASIIEESDNSRFNRFKKVLSICKGHKKSKIVFLTYDKLFMPFLGIYLNEYYVYEHNTTPEMRFSVNAFWHKYLLNNTKHLCQFKHQYEMYKTLGKKNIYWIGSPVRNSIKKRIENPKNIYLTGYYYSEKELSKIIRDHKGCNIFIKKSSFEKNVDVSKYESIITNQLALNDKGIENIKKVVVKCRSKIRGSGWFNDCISYGLPIEFIDKTTKYVFETTFLNREEFNFVSESNGEYINHSNSKFKERFINALDCRI